MCTIGRLFKCHGGRPPRNHTDSAPCAKGTQYPITVRMAGEDLDITEEMAIRLEDVVNRGTLLPVDSTREDLLAYQYLLRKKNLELVELQNTLNERQATADSLSARRLAYSSSQSTGAEPGKRSM